MYVVDCGTNKATIYNSETDETKIISLIDVLNLPSNLPNGSLVVAESAHLGSPRTRLSRSQPFTEDLLLDLYQRFNDAGITLKLFPQQSTPNACSYSGLKKSDLNDPKSIYLYIDGHPNISLKNPPKSFTPDAKRLASYDFKRLTDALINVARQGDDAYSKDKCSIWIKENIESIASALTKEQKFWFGLSDNNRYKKKPNNFKYTQQGVRMNGLFAIVCTILDDEGKIRIRPETGNMPGFEYIKRYILRMSPFHHEGGVARSNLYHHIFKNQLFVRGKHLGLNFKRKVLSLDGEYKEIRRGNFNEIEDKFFREQRAEFSKTIRKIWQVSRDLLNNDPNIEKQDLLDHSEQSEFNFSSCSH